MYNFIIHLYKLGIKTAALLKPESKPALMVKGWKETMPKLENGMEPGRKYLWFHAASLGEFEQGRPLMEHIRKEHPEYGIVLTFFSPSGYEVRKNYQGADIICYLPMDTPKAARKFVETLRPAAAFFIKYEFWWNYLDSLKELGIPTYSVSSIFRDSQVFFKWYGGGYRRVLGCFTHLFVQDDNSVNLLKQIGITNTTVVGDTRFDRVIDVRDAAKDIPLVKAFKGESLTMVCGSSWGPDEDIFIRHFNEHPEMKLVIAPHVVSPERIKEIRDKLKRPFALYSESDEESVKKADCLIIDGYGFLSSVYRYGEIAYVGGGFGVGIHNVLEAAVYGVPVIFGPNNKRFREARALIREGGGFEINSYNEYEEIMSKFLKQPDYMKESGRKAGTFVSGQAGAVDKVLKAIKL